MADGAIAVTRRNFGDRGGARVAHAWIPASLYDELCAEADARGVHVDQLAAAIVTVVTRRKLFVAMFGE